MEKTKSKKTKTIQITYPAPYSQSWNAEAAPVLTKTSYGKSPKLVLFNSPKKQADNKTWSQSYSAVRGPDPTAPHLKYGVFPNRRVSSSRVLPKPPLKPTYNPHCQREQEELMRSKSFLVPSRKRPTKKAQLTDSPMLVIRALDKTFTKQLSLSEIMHVDIKPRKLISTAPSFCPPNFKALTQKFAV